MRSPPVDLDVPAIERAVAAGWDVRAVSIEYVPEGGGSHHWRFVDASGAGHFVTVDDLDDKAWFGHDRDAVFDGLTRALRTSTALRDGAGLDFVVAPVLTRDGGVLQRVSDRYTVSVFPHLSGTSYPFGRYQDPVLRERVIAMVAALHEATASVERIAPRHVIGFSGRRELDGFFVDPTTPWDGGPFAASAQESVGAYADRLVALVGAFDELVERTSASRADVVATHGEPHPANLMNVDGEVHLVDWDTAALAPPERDLWLIVEDDGDIERYERATGRGVDADVLTLYRLRWFLDDLGSAVRMFRNQHLDNADTRRWIEGLGRTLAQVDDWVIRLG